VATLVDGVDLVDVVDRVEAARSWLRSTLSTPSTKSTPVHLHAPLSLLAFIDNPPQHSHFSS
jgi:hypothetical protein